MKKMITTALAGAVLAGGLAVAPAASASSSGTGTTTIVCDAAKVRSQPEKGASANGIAYKGDTFVFDQWVYKKSEKTWYARGTATRADGAKISGYVLYDCANPYEGRGAPTPPIPK